VVALESVVVRYRRAVVLDGVSLSIAGGEAIAVGGSNGSGKTTLLRLLANLYRPNRGRRIGPRRCAFVPAALEPPPLSVGRWLATVARPGRRQLRPVLSALDDLGFDGQLSSGCRSLSFGNLRKLLLAEALTSGEPLIVADEATVGLDDHGVAALADAVASCCARGSAAIVADQGSEPRLDADRHLVVGGGTVTAMAQALAADPAPIVVSLAGPRAARPALLRAAARLGYEPAETASADRSGPA
jgi:branched-chain amino acid transport system ATP-binding protein